LVGFVVTEELAAIARTRDVGFAFGPRELGRDLAEFPARLFGETFFELLADGVDARVDAARSLPLIEIESGRERWSASTCMRTWSFGDEPG
jgi:hypothetical protein